MNLNAAITLINFFQDPKKEIVDTSKIYSSIRVAGFLMHFETSSVTFDDLKNTGNIKVLSNLELKKSLASYYTFIESAKNYRTLWMDKVWGDYWDARDQLINISMNSFWLNSFDRKQVNVELPVSFGVTEYQSKRFIQSLYNLIDITNFRKNVFNDIKAKTKDLLNKISKEIEV